MVDPDCTTCKGAGWVCETHPDKVWSDEFEDGCDCGPGMPCPKCCPHGEFPEIGDDAPFLRETMH